MVVLYSLSVIADAKSGNINGMRDVTGIVVTKQASSGRVFVLLRVDPTPERSWNGSSSVATAAISSRLSMLIETMAQASKYSVVSALVSGFKRRQGSDFLTSQAHHSIV